MSRPCRWNTFPWRVKRWCSWAAGGAAKAIAVECALAGAASVTIFNRSAAHGEELAQTVREHTDAQAFYQPWEAGQAIPEGTDILINATPIGFHPDASETGY